MHFNGMTLRFDCFTSSREIGAFWQSKDNPFNSCSITVSAVLRVRCRRRVNPNITSYMCNQLVACLKTWGLPFLALVTLKSRPMYVT